MTSRIDFICVPINTFCNGYASAAVVLDRDGRKLQLVSSAKRVDHNPLATFVLASELVQYDGTLKAVQWVYDSLVRALMASDRRQEFFDKVDIICNDNLELWEEISQTFSPSGSYAFIRDILFRAAQDVFSNRPSSDSALAQHKKAFARVVCGKTQASKRHTRQL